MNDGTTNHPDREQLAGFARNSLHGEEWGTIEEHVAACDSCRTVLEGFPEDALFGLLREAASAAHANDTPLRLHAGYQILEKIGQGGMGVVFKARQAGLNRLVALKQIHAGRHARPEALRRFRREAEAAARLHHPNIVQIYEVGEQDGQPYLALEYVNGGTLSNRLAGNPLLPAAAARLVECLARAIHCAHQQGIVHRDLKPGNILLQIADCRLQTDNANGLTPDLQSPISNLQSAIPKITDFGLARLLDQEVGQTRTGDILGTPAYMAPEQAAGQASAIGPAVDVYALGAILYETLSGRHARAGADARAGAAVAAAAESAARS
jgi:serine/threonine protein kinase